MNNGDKLFFIFVFCMIGASSFLIAYIVDTGEKRKEDFTKMAEDIKYHWSCSKITDYIEDRSINEYRDKNLSVLIAETWILKECWK